jgi:hypothetical protein
MRGLRSSCLGLSYSRCCPDSLFFCMRAFLFRNDQKPFFWVLLVVFSPIHCLESLWASIISTLRAACVFYLGPAFAYSRRCYAQHAWLALRETLAAIKPSNCSEDRSMTLRTIEPPSWPTTKRAQLLLPKRVIHPKLLLRPKQPLLPKQLRQLLRG